jgi:hypothetical protein
MEKKRKKAMALETLGWWILGAVALIIIILAIIILKGKGSSAVSYIKELFRFGA